MGLSAKRAQYAGPPGLKGLLHNGKTTVFYLLLVNYRSISVADHQSSPLLASLRWADLSMAVGAQSSITLDKIKEPVLTHEPDNQGMFGQILTMNSFIERVRRAPHSVREADNNADQTVRSILITMATLVSNRLC